MVLSLLLLLMLPPVRPCRISDSRSQRDISRAVATATFDESVGGLGLRFAALLYKRESPAEDGGGGAKYEAAAADTGNTLSVGGIGKPENTKDRY